MGLVYLSFTIPSKPDDMYDVKDENELQRIKDRKYPWTSPGTAPTFGNGCGAAGGSPYGCRCEDDGPVNYCYGNDKRPYGSCCGQREENVSIGWSIGIFKFQNAKLQFKT